MIYELPVGGGAYVFLFGSLQDGSCIADYLHGTTTEAERQCLEVLGIPHSSWREIDHPMPGCQDDWIAPVRMKRDQRGQPIWGQFEPVTEKSALENRVSEESL